MKVQPKALENKKHLDNFTSLMSRKKENYKKASKIQ